MHNPIQILHEIGQSIWLDNIQRRLLESGELATLIERNEIRGMTSNPSIFQNAIARSKDYDSALKPMAWSGYNSEQILDRLMIEDIRAAIDLFLPLYEQSGGGDGFVSIEVNPALAYDTQATLAEARRLWQTIDSPNLMVKIPATREGIPAIRAAIAEGININITLIFSIARYLEVMEAYISGLEDRHQSGLSIDTISSVASFFVSRIDNKVDPQLESIIKREGPEAERTAALMGKLAVANAKLAYSRFRSLFDSQRFAQLQDYGARLQRPLWASTSTKNPAYADTKYVDELIGAHTVNTIPPQTLEAFRDHGQARPTVEENLDEAQRAFEEAAELGISIEQVTKELEEEGVQAFANSFTSLLQTVEERRLAALRELGPLSKAIASRIAQLESDSVHARIHELDPSLWTLDPRGQEEVRRRLGWLQLPETSRDLVDGLSLFSAEIGSAGYTHGLLLGMGGSSLAPEVLRSVFGVREPGLDLSILDSTDPIQVLEADRNNSPGRSLYIVASKSGGTAEVSAMFDYFWEKCQHEDGGRSGDHFIAITDPGTELEALAGERRFRKVFLADPSVGGRFSALSAFGLVPGSLINLDVERMLERGSWMANQCEPDVPAGRNPGLVLGAIMGEAALHERDKLTIIAEAGLSSMGAWLEQLIAESSGKQGKGIIPIIDEPIQEAQEYGPDRFFVYLRREGDSDGLVERLKEAGHPALTIDIGDENDLGAEFYRWEFATAIACSILGVNAFDQPDVQDSKNRTKNKIAEYLRDGKLEEGFLLGEAEGIRFYGAVPERFGDLSPAAVIDLKEVQDGVAVVLSDFLSQAKPGDYVALNAFLPRKGEYEDLLNKLRIAITSRTGLATTYGFGPRYLHSTGQLHKGGPNKGLFLLITAVPSEDIPIPGKGVTFGTMQMAQALGDLEALFARGRRALRIHLPGPNHLNILLEAVDKGKG